MCEDGSCGITTPPISDDGAIRVVPLYNAIFGRTKLSNHWLAFLDLQPDQFERALDAYLVDDQPGGVRIVVLTECAGANREGSADVFAMVQQHPQYIRTVDEPYGNDYCRFEFSIPRKYADHVDMAIKMFTEAGKRDEIVINMPLGDRFEAVKGESASMAATIERASHGIARSVIYRVGNVAIEFVHPDVLFGQEETAP